MQLFGQAQVQDGRYSAGYPDFAQEWQASKKATEPSGLEIPVGMSEEFSRGVSSGVQSLKSTAVGLGALAAGAMGYEEGKDTLVKKFSQMEQEGEVEGPTVSKVEDITGPETAARWVLGQLGQLVPNIAEAAVVGAAGAAVGSSAAPGPGTFAGGAGGIVESFVARKAVKSALAALVKRGADIIGESEARAVAKEQLEQLAENGVVKALAPQTQRLLEREATNLSRKYGANTASVLNFFGQGAGGEYGKLAAGGAEDDDARVASAIAGLGSAGSIFLPAAVTSRLFPSLGEEVANSYVKRLATDAVKEIPMAASGMGLMEVANVAADRYADPARRDQPLTHEELSRILNASIVGAMASGITAPLTALVPPKHFDPLIEKQHLKELDDDRRLELQALKTRMESGQGTLDDQAKVKALTDAERTFYGMYEPSKEAGPKAAATAAEGSGAGLAPAPAAPAPTGVERFAAEYTPKSNNKLSTQVGMELRTTDDLGQIAEIRRQARQQQIDLLKQIESSTDEKEKSKLMQEATDLGFKAQLAGESIQVATNTAAWVEGDRIKLGDRPLDWTEHQEVAQWLAENPDATPHKPDPAAYRKAYDKAQGAAENIKNQILALPADKQWAATMDRHQELVNIGKRASYFKSEADRLQGLIDTKVAAKRAAAAMATPSVDPLAAALRSRAEAKLRQARAQTNTNPSAAQSVAENYKKGKVSGTDLGLSGLTISIENPKGTERHAADGSWKVTMPGDYGYFLGTKGMDGQPIDVTIGLNHEAPTVYVIDQVDATTGKPDEHKVLLGYGSKAQAEAAYDASFSDGKGPERRKTTTAMTKDEFKAWVTDEKQTSKPLSKEIYASGKPSTEPANAGGAQPKVAGEL